jgi:methionyl aminopeptidase
MTTGVLKRPDEIALIRQSAAVVAEALELAGRLIRPGVTTGEINRSIEELIRRRGCVPSFLGYHEYPAATCISINEQVVHGIPGDRVLEEGDIVGVDVGAFRSGFHGDAARTFPVGAITEEATRLLRTAEEALARGIAAVRAGGRVGAISHAIQTWVEAQGFSVVRDLVGHGVGRKLHEDPQVPNFGPTESGPVLRPGIVLAIEPMVNAGTWEVETLPDRWTVVTKDRRLSAHFEHTVAVTEAGAEILSRLD